MQSAAQTDLTSTTPTIPSEPPVPPPTPLVLGSNITYMYNYPSDGKISRVNYATNSTSEVAQVANVIHGISKTPYETTKRVSTASATVQYFTESLTYKTYRFSNLTETTTEVGTFDTANEPYSVVSDDALIVQRQSDGEVFFSSPTVSPTVIASAFGFAVNIGAINPASKVVPLGKNYFLAAHDGTNTDKVLLLNGNNLTYTTISIPGIQSVIQMYPFNHITHESGSMVYVEYNDGSNNIERIYYFNYASNTIHLVDTINPSKSSLYYYRFLPTRDGNYIYTTNGSGGDYLVYTINSQTNTVTLKKTVLGSQDPYGYLANSNCSELFTNLSVSRLYTSCWSSFWNGSANEYTLYIYEINLVTGNFATYTTTAPVFTYTNLGMYRDNFYIISDTDGNSTKEFKKLVLSGGNITFDTTNDLEDILKLQVCSQLGKPSNCSVTFNYDGASMLSANDSMVSKKQAYEWTAFYFISAGLTPYQVTVDGVTYDLSAAVVHNDDVYLPTPTAPSGNMGNILGGLIWAIGFFSNYIISNLWLDLF